MLVIQCNNIYLKMEPKFVFMLISITVSDDDRSYTG